MLDGIRAILRHRKTIPNPAGNEVIITGYSGGGHGASWAVQLANEYAPELNIIGAAYGGTPVDLEVSLRFSFDALTVQFTDKPCPCPVCPRSAQQEPLRWLRRSWVSL